MSETLKSLNNIRSLRAQARECSLETLEEILEKFQVIVEEKREYEALIKAVEIERENKKRKLLDIITKEGFDPADLLDLTIDNPKQARKSSKREPRPAKYQYELVSGKIKTWTGQGRMPSPIKDAIENEGKKLSDFLI
ncbi:H-NS family histone-like protein [Thorsellia kenyensis]|uniref:DNA-binding protein n=1 Tax=Thorsellia kenyensis TaxID=1549888 RepID=A0ABV6CAC1_9GAMM